MLKNREVLLAKAEVTYNTDPVPTAAANAILVENLGWSFVGARMAERPAIRASLGQLKPIYAGSLMQFSFDVEIKGSGAAGTAPEIGVLLQGCAMSETIVASTSVTYKPASTAHKSLTLYFHQDGLLYKLTGARGRVKAMLRVGEVGKLSFEFVGHFSGPTDVALPTPTYNATVPVPALSAAFSIDSYSAIVTGLEFDLGNNVVTPGDIAKADGYGEIQIVQRKLTGSFDVETVLVAAHNFISKWTGGNAMALASGTVGATAGNRYAVSMPAVTYTEVGKGDKDSISTFDLSFQGAESTTDDEVSIAFT